MISVTCSNCIHTLTGHTATIRSLKLLHRSPTAVTGARDRTVRVWDIQKGRLLRVLEGHEDRVRCVEVCGRRAVSGSYDGTCRVSLSIFNRMYMAAAGAVGHWVTDFVLATDVGHRHG